MTSYPNSRRERMKNLVCRKLKPKRFGRKNASAASRWIERIAPYIRDNYAGDACRKRENKMQELVLRQAQIQQQLQLHLQLQQQLQEDLIRNLREQNRFIQFQWLRNDGNVEK